MALYPSGSSFDAGAFVAWEWKWGPSIEFERNNRGLIDGKAIVEAKAREAALRDASRSSLHTPTSAIHLDGRGPFPADREVQPASRVVRQSGRRQGTSLIAGG